MDTQAIAIVLTAMGFTFFCITLMNQRARKLLGWVALFLIAALIIGFAMSRS